MEVKFVNNKFTSETDSNYLCVIVNQIGRLQVAQSRVTNTPMLEGYNAVKSYPHLRLM